MNNINSLCVYCGSSLGRNPEYTQAAKNLADTLVAHNISLVYGGAGIGIMGVVADQVLAKGGKVIGVIPKALAQKEVMHQQLTELHITQSMHERKTLMAELADGFIALPGGIGTLEELFEIWTWAQLGFHSKPCGLLNIAGYYQHLIAFLAHVQSEAFVKPQHHDLLMVESDPKTLITRFLDYQPQSISRYFNKDQV